MDSGVTGGCNEDTTVHVRAASQSVEEEEVDITRVLEKKLLPDDASVRGGCDVATVDRGEIPQTV